LGISRREKAMDVSGFAARLKELREQAGLTQKGLAEKAGMALSGVNKLEQGVNKPSWESVVALTEALGVDCRAFLEPAGDIPEARRGRPPKPRQLGKQPAPKRPRGRPRKEK
jgi:transcriptional regulator with XRE-family HTH domain